MYEKQIVLYQKKIQPNLQKSHKLLYRQVKSVAINAPKLINDVVFTVS